jgi:hypothetical protein
MVEFTLRNGWENRYTLAAPPDLSADIESRRWRNVNRLVLSPLLLRSRVDEGRPLLAVLQMARSIVPAERGLLSMWDDSMGTLEIAADFGFEPRLPERLRRSNPLAAAAVRSRKPVLVSRVDDLALARELRALGKPSWLSAPIMRQGAPWGVIQIGRAEAYREEDAILLWLYALVLEGVLPGLVQCQDDAFSSSSRMVSGRSV